LFGEDVHKKKKQKKSKKRSGNGADDSVIEGDVPEIREGDDDGDDGDDDEKEKESTVKDEREQEEEEEELLRNAGGDAKKRKSIWSKILSSPFSALVNSMDSEGGGGGVDGEVDIEANVGSIPMRRLGNLSGDSELDKRKSVVTNCYASSPSLRFGVGMKQTFEAPINAQLVLNSCDTQRFSFAFESATSERYPLLIELSLANIASVAQQSPSLKVVTSQFTIVQFAKVTDDPETYRTAVVNQFFEDNSTDSNAKAKQRDDDEGSDSEKKDGNSRRNRNLCEFKDVYGIFDSEPDCVVCLCEPKAATILPCRHFCVCFSCMLKLDKCPVCRTKIKSYMRFYHPDEEQQQQQQQTLPSSSSPDYNNKEL